MSATMSASHWFPIAIGFLALFAILAALSKSLYAVIAASILAAAALFLQFAPDSTPTIIAVACAAGSILVLWIGRQVRLYRRAVRRDLLSLEDKLAAIASQNTLIEIRKAELDLLLKNANSNETHADEAKLVPSQNETSAQSPRE